MTRDDVGMVAVIVAIGLAILLAASTLAGCSASLPYGRPGLLIKTHLEAYSNE
jgi:hypothetical protein